MNKTKPDNPQAFPLSLDDGREVKWNKGMTLLDYFAGKAMQGLILLPTNLTGQEARDDLAEISYKISRAMLKERENHL